MKKNKLTLEHIELKSFITTINEAEKQTIQGANEAALAGSWLISGCLTTLRCGATTIVDDQSATWTKAEGLVGACRNNTREKLTAIGQCPACVKIERVRPEA